MDKIILLSIVFATVAIPSITARTSSGKRGMIVNLVLMAVFVLLYTFALLFIAVNLIDTRPPPGWSM